MKGVYVWLGFYRKFLVVLIICLFVFPLSDILKTLSEVNVIMSIRTKWYILYYFNFSSISTKGPERQWRILRCG